MAYYGRIEPAITLRPKMKKIIISAVVVIISFSSCLSFADTVFEMYPVKGELLTEPNGISSSGKPPICM
jgi:hypothetical protein